MGIDQNAASIFRRRKNSGGAAKTRGSFNYPIQDPGTRVFQLKGFSLFKDEKYGKEKFDYMKVRITFILLGEGDADNADDHDTLREQAHGKWFSREHHPIASPPAVNPQTQEKFRASGLYDDLRFLANGGRSLKPFEQLGIVDEDDDEQMEVLRAWVKTYNRGKDAEDRITDMDEAMAQYAAVKVAELMNSLENSGEPIQVEGTLDLKEGANGEYNKLVGLTGLLKGRKLLPAYKPVPQPLDPRTADDDPNILCTDCGGQTHGYLRRTDNVWVDNRQAAELSEKQHGAVLCGKCIWSKSQNGKGAKPSRKLVEDDAPEAEAPRKPAAKPAAKPAPKNAPAEVDANAAEDGDEDLPF